MQIVMGSSQLPGMGQGVTHLQPQQGRCVLHNPEELTAGCYEENVTPA